MLVKRFRNLWTSGFAGISDFDENGNARRGKLERPNMKYRKEKEDIKDASLGVC